MRGDGSNEVTDGGKRMNYRIETVIVLCSGV
jgi:hypothetical protein